MKKKKKRINGLRGRIIIQRISSGMRYETRDIFRVIRAKFWRAELSVFENTQEKFSKKEFLLASLFVERERENEERKKNPLAFEYRSNV